MLVVMGICLLSLSVARYWTAGGGKRSRMARQSLPTVHNYLAVIIEWPFTWHDRTQSAFPPLPKVNHGDHYTIRLSLVLDNPSY